MSLAKAVSRAVITVLTRGVEKVSLGTFRVLAIEGVSLAEDGSIRCLGGGCGAKGTVIILEAVKGFDAGELHSALSKMRVVKLEVEVTGLPKPILTRLEILTGRPIKGDAVVKYTWHSTPSLEELALVLNDLNLPTPPQNPQS